jgi:hypothetical protein
VHGKDITIPKGTEITAYTNGDIPLDPEKFVTQTAMSAEPSAAIVQPAADAPATQNGKGLDERMPVTVNVSTCPSTNREVLSPMLSDEGRLPQ